MPPSAATRIVVLSRPTGRYRSPPGAVNATWVSSGATTRGTQRPGSGISVPTSPVRVSTRRRIVPSPVVQTAVPDGVGNPAPSTRVADPRSRARPAFVSTSTASGTAGPAGTRRAHPASTATPPASVRNVRRVVIPSRHRGTSPGSTVSTVHEQRRCQLDDAEAVALARTGDLDAYEALVTRYTALAHRTAVLLGAGDDAEDVVQEAFVKAYRRLGLFRGDSPFRPWLLAIVANETRNLHRVRRRRAGLVLRAASREEPAATGPDRPAGAAAAAGRRGGPPPPARP